MSDENGYWWCPRCDLQISAQDVTFDERHDGCGQSVMWIEAGDPIANLRCQLAATTAERDVETAAREKAEAACERKDELLFAYEQTGFPVNKAHTAILDKLARLRAENFRLRQEAMMRLEVDPRQLPPLRSKAAQTTKEAHQ